MDGKTCARGYKLQWVGVCSRTLLPCSWPVWLLGASSHAPPDPLYPSLSMGALKHWVTPRVPRACDVQGSKAAMNLKGKVVHASIP